MAPGRRPSQENAAEMPGFAPIARRLAALLAPFAALPFLRPPAPAAAAPPPSLAMLMQRLQAEPALRSSFAQDPQAMLRAAGLDPAGFNIGSSLSPAQLEALLQRCQARPSGQGFATPVQGTPPMRSGPPAAVYGPPPGPPQQNWAPPPPNPPPQQESVKPRPLPPERTPDRAAPPAPVYGPPPGLR